MELQDLVSVKGSTRSKRRIGRGHGSGWGKTAGKGHKGQNARSGGGVRPGFEGGQMPLQRRIPKRGFNNIFAKKVVAVNVGELEKFGEGSVIDANELISMGLVNRSFDKIKILGEGNLTKNLTVKAQMFSKSAKEKIESAGGKAEVI
ncbi:MAG: 50S ribosomal protein L15 [Clostridia bacterium]|nr:50S ribosomal protein L15 [Clostridia bacterium]MDO4199211.1 50S ribosomal protein L15 [Clostridia bacterium]